MIVHRGDAEARRKTRRIGVAVWVGMIVPSRGWGAEEAESAEGRHPRGFAEYRGRILVAAGGHGELVKVGEESVHDCSPRRRRGAEENEENWGVCVSRDDRAFPRLGRRGSRGKRKEECSLHSTFIEIFLISFSASPRLGGELFLLARLGGGFFYRGCGGFEIFYGLRV